MFTCEKCQYFLACKSCPLNPFGFDPDPIKKHTYCSKICRKAGLFGITRVKIDKDRQDFIFLGYS